jgi:hypothetical protein
MGLSTWCSIHAPFLALEISMLSYQHKQRSTRHRSQRLSVFTAHTKQIDWLVSKSNYYSCHSCWIWWMTWYFAVLEVSRNKCQLLSPLSYLLVHNQQRGTALYCSNICCLACLWLSRSWNILFIFSRKWWMTKNSCSDCCDVWPSLYLRSDVFHIWRRFR